MNLLNTVEVFRHKPRIMKKAEGYLNALHDALAADLEGRESDFPPHTKLKKGQLVRGENHKGFPFLSLDIPQRFSKEEMLTYRTLFWWGHYLGFSLILKGEALPGYLERLLERREQPDWGEIYLATAASPWEWSPTKDNFVRVSAAPSEDLRRIVQKIDYMKLCRFHPIHAPEFPALDWVAAGRDAWNTLSRVIVD